MSDKPDKKPTLLGGLAGAIGSAVGDIAREVRQDLQDMTPPATQAKPADDPALARTVSSASSGLAFVDVGGEDVLAEVPASTTPKQLAAPWDAVLEGGKVTVDAGFFAASGEDVVRYMAALSQENGFPYTMAILAAEAGDEEQTAALTGATVVEPRLFGALAFGPRKLQDDAEALDRALTKLINDNPKIIALGPLLIDEPYAPYTLPQQEAQLLVQLEIAADFGLPAFVGHRRSLASLQDCLGRAEGLPKLVWADMLADEAELALVKQHDMHVLVRPELTYAANDGYRQLVKKVPENRLLLGAGSALVAPQSRSGHAGGPESLPPTLKALAELLDKPIKELREVLNRTAHTLFVTS
ncbi:MAG: TatD family hydrolase [Pseudomonadaceae bacterium]|nr:TatD family hydrolase [Pseudomonadaceae bacterium]